MKVIENIHKVLSQQYPYSGYRCDQCGTLYGHSLIYCAGCPGRLYKVQQTNLEALIFYKGKGYYNICKENILHIYKQQFIFKDGANTGMKRMAREYSFNEKEFNRIIDELVGL